MSDTNFVWDGNNQTTHSDPVDELGYNELWEPWKNIIINIKTATANITHLQRLARRKNTYMKTEHIADTLERKGLMEHTITI